MDRSSDKPPFGVGGQPPEAYRHAGRTTAVPGVDFPHPGNFTGHGREPGDGEPRFDGAQKQEDKVSSLINVCSYLVVELQELKKDHKRLMQDHMTDVIHRAADNVTPVRWPFESILEVQTQHIGVLQGKDEIEQYITKLEDALAGIVGREGSVEIAAIKNRLGW